MTLVDDVDKSREATTTRTTDITNEQQLIFVPFSWACPRCRNGGFSRMPTSNPGCIMVVVDLFIAPVIVERVFPTSRSRQQPKNKNNNNGKQCQKLLAVMECQQLRPRMQMRNQSRTSKRFFYINLFTNGVFG